MLLTVLSWIATISVLVSYAVMVRTGWLRQFNVTNFVANFPLVIGAVTAGLFANAFLSGAFGLIALWGLLRPPAPADEADRLAAAHDSIVDLQTECEMQEAWANELHDILGKVVATGAVVQKGSAWWVVSAGVAQQLDLDAGQGVTLENMLSRVES